MKAIQKLWAPLVAAVAIVSLIALALKGYDYAWTGFGPSIAPSGEATAGKALWDWLDLLIVPVVLAVGAWLIEGSRKRSERRVEDDRQRQQILEQYLDFMTPMLSDGKLDGDVSDRVQSLVRTRTLTALRLLDSRRKAQLLQFIYEAGLISKAPVIRLTGGTLDGVDLEDATLAGAELRGVYLRGATLRNADLNGADLRGSDLSRADLRGARLSNSDLRQATLCRAKLHNAVLSGALSDQVDAAGARPAATQALLMQYREHQEA